MKQLLLLPMIITHCFFLCGQTSVETGSPVIRFTDSVSRTPVKDQSRSPTCWVFGANSLFESDAIKKYGCQLDLSEMYIARYAYIDKTKQFLATNGETYCEGGGQFHDVIRVIKKHGMMPEEAYTGKIEGQYNHDHAKLDSSMKRLRLKWLNQEKRELTKQDIKQLNDTLDHYLGKLPENFRYDDKNYTAKTFAEKIAGFSDDYIELMSFASLPSYKKCLLKDKFNWSGDSLYNVTLDDLQVIIDTALAKGWSVGWEGDVTNAGFNYYSGYATESSTFNNYDMVRELNYKNELTERDHMLHIVGVGKDDDNKKWYYLKNSWGTWMNPFKGYLFMGSNYFKLNTVIMMVNKNGLPQALKEKLGINF